MSRSGYCDDLGEEDPIALARWRSAVSRAIRGCWGQAFLIEMAAALDAMPVKELVTDVVVDDDKNVCAIGSVALAKNIDVTGLDVEDADAVSRTFGIAPAMAREIAYQNDEGGIRSETPAERWTRMREWVRERIIPVPLESNSTPTEEKR